MENIIFCAVTINQNICKNVMTKGAEVCDQRISSSNKNIQENAMKAWKNQILQVKNRIKNLKQRVKPKKTKNSNYL